MQKSEVPENFFFRLCCLLCYITLQRSSYGQMDSIMDSHGTGPYQWIAQQQVGPVSEYCDVIGCHALCLQLGISLLQQIGLSITALSRHRHNMTSDVKATLNPNK